MFAAQALHFIFIYGGVFQPLLLCGRVGRVDGPSDFFPAKLSLAPVCLCMVWKGQSDLGQYLQCLEFRFVVKPTYSGVSQAYFPIPVCH